MGVNDELLYNQVNPAIVSRILFHTGKRISKSHPYFYRLHKKKYGIFAWRDDIFGDCFIRPEVVILGSDGNVLLRIICKSNDSGRKLRNELEDELNEWVRNNRGKG